MRGLSARRPIRCPSELTKGRHPEPRRAVLPASGREAASRPQPRPPGTDPGCEDKDRLGALIVAKCAGFPHRLDGGIRSQEAVEELVEGGTSA